MIKCPKCRNENQENIYQHDRSLAGWHDYGTFFTCLICKEDFHVKRHEADEDTIKKWPDV